MKCLVFIIVAETLAHHVAPYLFGQCRGQVASKKHAENTNWQKYYKLETGFKHMGQIGVRTAYTPLIR